MREQIRWPIWLWALFLALDLSIFLAVGVAMTGTALILTALILLAATCLFWAKSKLTIEVNENRLRVGRANIGLQYLDSVTALNEESMRFERGIGLDPRAFLAIRFWVKTGAKITLKDPRDPTPYWLISTKRAAELKQRIGVN